MKLITALTAVTLITAPAFAGKINCRNAKGQIAKASECAGKPAPAASDETPTAANTKKVAGGRCQWTTNTDKHKAGRFASCPK